MTAESVLIVEDEGLIALHLIELMSAAGYDNIDSVASGEEALAMVSRVTVPDLILMDIGPAGIIDGIETVMIREHSDVPIIFITANASDQIPARIKGIARTNYLIKPFLSRDLLSAVRRPSQGIDTNRNISITVAIATGMKSLTRVDNGQPDSLCPKQCRTRCH